MYDENPNTQDALTGTGRQQTQYQPPTARQQLQQKAAALRAILNKVETALKALDAHPELEEFTETLKAALP